MNKKPQSSVIGAAGEHLVLSHLLRLGYIAGKTPDFTKDYDLVVLNKDGNDSAPIQVKTSSQRRWIMHKKHEIPIDKLFYCFVGMSVDDSNSEITNSEIFVIDSNTVSNFVKTSHKIWLKVPGRKGKPHNKTDIRTLASDVKTIFNFNKNLEAIVEKNELEFINNHSEGWLEKYKNAWHLIKT